VQSKVDLMRELLGPTAIAPLLMRLPVILTLSATRFTEVGRQPEWGFIRFEGVWFVCGMLCVG
jgi:hypothetical protein